MKNRIKIEDYASYFHDGSIRDIRHWKNVMVLSMESAQLRQEWNNDGIILSKRETLTGKLHIKGINIIKQNEIVFPNILKKMDSFEKASIYRFDIKGNKILLLFWWIKYFPAREESDMFEYEINAEEVYWENIPTLFDDYWDSLENPK